MRVFVMMAFLGAGCIPAHTVLAQPSDNLFGRNVFNKGQTIESRIKIEKISAEAAVIRDVTGDYKQHEKMFTDLMAFVPKYVATLGKPPDLARVGIGAGGACFGIYPVDPDAVINPPDLKWQVGMNVTHTTPEQVKSAMVVLNKKKPAAPYRVMQLQETDAITLVTDVKNSPFDGHSMYRWLTEHPYVQTAPTRMEYTSHSGNPLDISVRIIIPVTKRRSGLALPPEH